MANTNNGTTSGIGAGDYNAINTGSTSCFVGAGVGNTVSGIESGSGQRQILDGLEW